MKTIHSKRARPTIMTTEYNLCQSDPVYFIENFFYYDDILYGSQTLKLFPWQKQFINTLQTNRCVVGAHCRQAGTSLLLAAYALWQITFHQNKRVKIGTHSFIRATFLMDDIKKAQKKLPSFLTSPITFSNAASIEFSNGSKLSIARTSSTFCRGETNDLILIDGLPVLSPIEQVDTLATILPSLHLGGKLVITGTPNGKNTAFYDIWSGAKAGTNSWTASTVTWNQLPGLDSNWQRAAISLMGQDAFDTEYECMFK